MTDPTPTPIQRMMGDFAPKIVDLTDRVLFGDVWERPELSPRDRSLITIASLVTGGNTQQLTSHIQRGVENGLSREEIVEAITHLAFYAGWPKALSSLGVAKELLEDDAP